MTIQQPSAHCMLQHRVSVREIREIAWRALFSAGLSTGEAASAADVITAMELYEATGLTALADQLRRKGPGHQPIRVIRDAVTWIDDPADRGPLLLAPLAVDLALAERRPVLIPSATVDAAYEWYSVAATALDRPDVSLAEISPDGWIRMASNISGATLARSVPASALTADLRELAQICAAAGGGLLIYPVERAPADAGIEVSTPAARDRRRRDALARGVTLDAAAWTAATRASRRFLVSEDDGA